MVAHSGGLPGYGSLMRWLPDYGVGIIAFGNVTYTGWNNAVAAAIDRLARTGGLSPRPATPSAALVAARDDVSKLVVRWDDALADKIAAENLFLDRSKDRRRKEIDDLARQGRRLHGPGGLRLRRERAARAMDDELRARRAAGGDHARADDAARGAVHGGASGAGTTGNCRALCHFLTAELLCSTDFRHEPRITRATRTSDTGHGQPGQHGYGGRITFRHAILLISLKALGLIRAALFSAGLAALVATIVSWVTSVAGGVRPAWAVSLQTFGLEIALAFLPAASDAKASAQVAAFIQRHDAAGMDVSWRLVWILGGFVVVLIALAVVRPR